METSLIFLDTTVIVGIVLILLFYRSLTIIKEGNVGVTTSFGKYKRILRSGLHFINPLSERVAKKISVQNKSIELEFSAITRDQANVDFKSMLLYTVKNQDDDTLRNVAFKFVDEANFMQALVRSVEGSIRAFVATKKQNEILGVRSEIAVSVREYLSINLADWGYSLLDLQINDILFDEAIMRSMAQVVASENMKTAAENEGEATLITKTKEAEAIRHSMILKAEGAAKSEEILAESMMEANRKLSTVNLDYSVMMFTQWAETMKHVSEHSHGNVIFFDGSADGMENTVKKMSALQFAKSN